MTKSTSGAGVDTNANTDANANGTIEGLLEQRAQFGQWLSKLDATADRAPAAVRERVRSDYEGRLRRVIDELRSHSATIAQELEHYRGIESELDAERRKAEEALAEAEIRHVVGEYGDEEWDRLSGESQRHLDGLRGELENVGAEIARLAEVQSLIAAPVRTRDGATSANGSTAPAAAPVVPAPVAAPSPPPAAAPSPVQPALFEVPEMSPAPAASAPAEPVVTGSPLDELAFLKSVSDEERKPAAAGRRSSPAGGSPAARSVEQSGAASAPAPTPAAPAPAPAPAPSAAPAGAATGGASKAAGMAKTLKCNECGTFNRPTEWYCERCGAELAAL